RWLATRIYVAIERRGVRDAIRFPGYVPFEDLPALYSAAEMFVYPSMYEGFGLPVIEAMACGTPVVTGSAAAVAEIGGGAVDHVETIDAESLGRALVGLARHPDRRRELASAGRARGRQFSWVRAASQSLELYQQVANGRRSDAFALQATAGGARSDAAPARTDVLFGQAYFLRFDPKLWNAQQPYAPLGALYAAACARERG